eukprot:8136609-Pyramimonas_sp.AAC.1
MVGDEAPRKKKRGPKSRADMKAERARDRMFLRHLEDVEGNRREVTDEGKLFIERYRSGHTRKATRSNKFDGEEEEGLTWRMRRNKLRSRRWAARRRYADLPG